jgi:hypothetical protein
MLAGAFCWRLMERRQAVIGKASIQRINTERAFVRRNYHIVKWASTFGIIVLAGMAMPALRGPFTAARFQMKETLGMACSMDSGAEAALRSMPKLQTRQSNPHLIEDENGKPFFMAGVCPQNIVHWITAGQMDLYFADRQKRDFNFAWVVINAFTRQETKL